MPRDKKKHLVERVQTGVRIEKRILKVLKALAEYHDITLGDLLEGIVLHAFDGKAPFSKKTLSTIADLKRIYGLDLDATASHETLGAVEVTTDDELLAGVESCTLPPERFGHREHVRLAWIVLRREEPEAALIRIVRAIRSYAISVGHPGKYHATITWAFVALVNERLERTGRDATWEEFAAENPDLFDAKILKAYYDRDVLTSDLARGTFVLPKRA